MATGLDCKSTAQVRLATTGWAGDQNVVMLMYPAAAEQVRELTFIQAPGTAVIYILRVGLELEPGEAKEPGHFIIRAVGGFPINKQSQPLVEAKLLVR